MKNGDFIRSLDDDRMTRFLWTWSLNCVTSFLTYGGTKLMDAKQLKEWLNSTEFVCEETRVGDDLIFDQNFDLVEEYAE